VHRSMGVEGAKVVVTGGSGLCGRRLVEMLAERKAGLVVSVDIAAPPADALKAHNVEYVQADIADVEALKAAFKGAQCVFHIAALVGPFFPDAKYWQVNYQGTLNVIEACKAVGVPKIVMSSSPSTRLDGSDVVNLSEDEMPICFGNFSHLYAETKAKGEVALRNACCDKLMTIAVAPHQVYGPRDGLFLPNLLHAAKTGRLRVFGNGENMISFCHVDNYCHGLILAYDALYPGSPALGKYYVITDDEPQKFWKVLDQAIIGVGLASIFSKVKLPKWFLICVAYIAKFFGDLVGKQFKLNPFTVKMLTIHRTFNIDAAKRDLKYQPLIKFEQGWKETIEWFNNNPDFWQEAAKRTIKKK